MQVDLKRSEFRRDIQGLRGIAVLLVVLYHAHVPFVSGGYIGVDVFFVISGYLITGLLVREVEANGRVDFIHFYARRARRLLPAAWFLILVVLAAAGLLYPPLEQGEIFSASRAAAVYLVNFWFTGRAVDYLGGGYASNPMLHMWSLAVEEQFYLVWPPLIAGAVFAASAAGRRTRIVGVVAAVTLISFAGCVWMTWKSQPWAFFGMPFRAWEFGLGALAYFAGAGVARGRFVWARHAGSFGVLLVLLGVFALNEASLFPGVWALLPVVGTALVIVAVQSPQRYPLRSFLSSRLLSRLGDVSYSWYLWHWPALVFAAVAFPHGGPLAAAIAVVVSLALAEASYRFIENPVRYSRVGGGDARVVVLALAVSCAVAVIATVLARGASTRDIPVEQQVYAAAREDVARVMAGGCHADLDAIDLPECAFGRTDSRVTIALLGDSHAAHWFPAFEQLALKHEWRLLSLTKSSCPSVAVQVVSDTKRRTYFECEQWRAAMWERLAGQKPAFVVLANSSRYDAAVDWEAGVLGAIRYFAAHRIPIVVIRDTPLPGFNVPVCLARMSWMKRDADSECSFRRDAALKAGAAVWDAEVRAVSSYDRGLAIDMTDAICPAERCGVTRGGMVLFSDSNHLTAQYSASLAPELAAKLRESASRLGGPIRELFAND